MIVNSNISLIRSSTLLSESFSRQRKEVYNSALPFPHCVIDDFLVSEWFESISDKFPLKSKSDWISYIHYNERKYGCSDLLTMPHEYKELIYELNSVAFCEKLSELVGIKNLVSDPYLDGGGLHITEKGGFLNIHSDFSSHHKNKHWKRRVNLILFLNNSWNDNYKGGLELWNKSLSQCEVLEVKPNRCVVFTTDEDSLHGYPEPIDCPEGMSRKSLALYYYTIEEKVLSISPTKYYKRKDDGKNIVLVRLDSFAIYMYSKIKYYFGINDRFVSRMVDLLTRTK